MRFRQNGAPAVISTAGDPIVMEAQYPGWIVRDVLSDRVLTRIGDRSYTAALAPDGSFVATVGSADSVGSSLSITVFELPSGRQRWSRALAAGAAPPKKGRKGATKAYNAARLLLASPNSSHVAVQLTSGDVTLLSAKDGSTTATLTGRSGDLKAVSRDGAYALFAEAGVAGRFYGPDRVKQVEVVDTRTSAVVRKLSPNVVASVSLSADGREILALTEDALVAVQAATGARREVARRSSERISLARSAPHLLLSPDSSRAAWAEGEKTLVVNVSTGRVEHEALQGEAVAFSADGSRLLLRSGDVAHMSGVLAQVPEGHTDAVTDVTFFDGGSLLVSAGRDVRFWRPKTGRMTAKALENKRVDVLASDPKARHLVIAAPELSAVTPDGDLVAIGVPEPSGFSATQRVPSVGSAAPLPGGEAVLVALENNVFSGARPSPVRLWSMKEQAEIAKADIPDPRGVAAGPQGTKVAVIARGDQGSLVHILDATTLKEERILKVNSWVATHILFTGTDQKLVVAARSGLTLFDTTTGSAERRYDVGSCCSVAAASADGRYLAGAAEKVVYLWQVEPRKLLGVLYGHKAEVTALAFSPDGALLATGSKDSSILVWDTQAPPPVERSWSTVEIPAATSASQLTRDVDGFRLRVGRGPGAVVRTGYFDHTGTLQIGKAPTRAPDLVDLASSNGASCYVDAKGAVRCWGLPFGGALGKKPPARKRGVPLSATLVESPQPVTLSGKAKAVYGGSEYVCALLESGKLSCWGTLLTGSRFLIASPDSTFPGGSSLVEALPAEVSGLTDVTFVGIGDRFACALQKGGKVFCWGDGAEGQLGTAQGAGSAVPVAVPGISDARALAVGASHACVLLGSGAVTCWGANESSQLGDGSGVTKRIPHTMTGPFTELSAGRDATCAKKASGEVLCWGELGQRGALPLYEPTQVAEANGLSDLRLLGGYVCGGRGSLVVCVGQKPAREPD